MEGTPATDGYTSLVGKIYDGSSPSQLVWENDMTGGGCVLLTPRVPFCETSCGGSAVCVEDGVCEPYPAAQSVGDVTATNIRTLAGATTFVMTPIANNYQADEALAYPAFAEGDDVALAAAGSDFASAFELHAQGIAPLVLSDDALALDAASALAVRWTPPDSSGASRVLVSLDISHHGGTKGKIECDVADSGSLDIPASLISRLLALGVAGFPTIVVTRESRGTATLALGDVELVVYSRIERSVEVPGVLSCTDDAECESPATCQPDLTCG
jgi:hypothetical protein